MFNKRYVLEQKIKRKKVRWNRQCTSADSFFYFGLKIFFSDAFFAFEMDREYFGNPRVGETGIRRGDFTRDRNGR
jgi:hypothetical protein